MSVQINPVMFQCQMRLAYYPNCHTRMDILPLSRRFLSDGVEDQAVLNFFFFFFYLSSFKLKDYLCTCCHTETGAIPKLFPFFFLSPPPLGTTPKESYVKVQHIPKNNIFQRVIGPTNHVLIIALKYREYLFPALHREEEKIHKSHPKVHHRTLSCYSI